MSDYGKYGNIFAGQYNDAMKAAAEERKRERGTSEFFAGDVQRGLDQEIGAPTPPVGESVQRDDAQFDPGVDEDVETTKNFLLKRAKERLNEVASVED